MRKAKKKQVRLCIWCLESLEFNCGKQHSMHIWVNSKDENESRCSFCKGTGFDSLYII